MAFLHLSNRNTNCHIDLLCSAILFVIDYWHVNLLFVFRDRLYMKKGWINTANCPPPPWIRWIRAESDNLLDMWNEWIKTLISILIGKKPLTLKNRMNALTFRTGNFIFAVEFWQTLLVKNLWSGICNSLTVKICLSKFGLKIWFKIWSKLYHDLQLVLICGI